MKKKMNETQLNDVVAGSKGGKRPTFAGAAEYLHTDPWAKTLTCKHCGMNTRGWLPFIMHDYSCYGYYEFGFKCVCGRNVWEGNVRYLVGSEIYLWFPN